MKPKRPPKKGDYIICFNNINKRNIVITSFSEIENIIHNNKIIIIELDHKKNYTDRKISENKILSNYRKTWKYF